MEGLVKRCSLAVLKICSESKTFYICILGPVLSSPPPADNNSSYCGPCRARLFKPKSFGSKTNSKYEVLRYPTLPLCICPSPVFLRRARTRFYDSGWQGCYSPNHCSYRHRKLNIMLTCGICLFTNSSRVRKQARWKSVL